MAGRMINGAAALAELIRPAGDTDEPGVHRVLPVVPELSGLLPSRGLRRGSTVAVATGQSRTGRSSANGPIDAVPAGAGGGTSLLLALLSAASRSGSWCAVVGVPALGALAAAESGIALDRLALVPNPGPEWPTVVAALIDGVDVVVVAVPGPVAPSIASRLVARARQRGCVLMPYGRWDGADVTLRVIRGIWEGLGAGHGRLRRREVTITARGRGAASRPKEITMWMPGITTPPPIPPAPASSGPRTPATAPPADPAPAALAPAASARVARASVVSAAAGLAPAASGRTAMASVGPAPAALEVVTSPGSAPSPANPARVGSGETSGDGRSGDRLRGAALFVVRPA
jgi:hypothetical protein